MKPIVLTIVVNPENREASVISSNLEHGDALKLLDTVRTLERELINTALADAHSEGEEKRE